MNVLPIEDIRETWDYDWANGGLIWKKGRGRTSPAQIGKRAGSATKVGDYWVLRISGKSFSVHRLVWAWHHGRFPVEQIDHINGIRGDNRIQNLREASPAQNQINKRRLKAFRSPYKGVYSSRGGSRWEARIGVNKKRITIGYFSTPEEARAAYLAAAIQHFGEFARAA